ncbi:diguanylate cyclase domain-containing protein [Agromyces sp. MMS24-JH15]|uniref:diguanylate cyclase domain-containing protein n=1 Tax=Agromyces sp. MMS24-JH15 TaxID=3243765 RepID=UPI0037481521
MILDTYTLYISLIVVTSVTGVLFVLDAFLRQADAAGRVWAVGFIAGIVTSFCLLVYAAYPSAWWAGSVALGANVLSIGSFWSGSRAYNRRADLLWIALVAAVATGAVEAVLIAQPGTTADLPLFAFALMTVFGALAMWESLRTPMRHHWTGRGLSVVFALVLVYYGARVLVGFLQGRDAASIRGILGLQTGVLVIISLTIVTGVCMTILQSERVPRLGDRSADVEFTADGLLVGNEFEDLLDDWAERAQFHGHPIGVIWVELDEQPSIVRAFGAATAERLIGDFAAIVRRHADVYALVAESEPGAVVIGGPYRVLLDAKDAAEDIRLGLRNQRVVAAEGMHLTASLGVAVSDRYGYDVGRLISEASRAAAESRVAGGDMVTVA